MTMPAAPPPQTTQADVLAHRLEALHGDVGDIKAALRDLATAVTRLAVVEERNVLKEIDELFANADAKPAAIEIELPRLGQR